MTDALFQMTLSFDDVLLAPRFSNIVTRKEVDISASICEHQLSLPIISSPMDTVTEGTMAIAMAKHGALGVIHRYNSISEQANIVRSVGEKTQTPSAAIGVSGDFLERAAALVRSGAKVLCIDVAHGHHANVERAIKSLKDTFTDSIAIIAGNVATPEAFTDLQSWGADAIRVGIGGGSICSTRIQTGHGIPTFHSVFACSFAKTTAKIIADGGIKSSGDIVKSLAAGADLVMLGSILAGTKESPGSVMRSSNGKNYKVYRGMASKAAQEDWRGEARSLEGITTTIPYKGHVSSILEDLGQNIRSGFSYSGARNQEELRKSAIFVRQTAAGNVESNTHILSAK